MATGQVTSRGRIGTAAGSGHALPTIVELAAAKGFRTGLVTTASVTDATPAAFAAHINFRRCENPTQMDSVIYKTIYLGECRRHLKANGGGGSIAEQLVNSKLDILLGGGRKHFLHPAEADPGTLLEMAASKGFHVVGQLDKLDTEAPTRVLGLFAPGTLPVRLRGAGDRAAERPRPDLLNQVSDHLGKVTLPEPMSCEDNPAYGSTPSLKAMTDTALAHLSRANQRGFFLMVESASIDKQSHERRPCGSIGEVAQLQEALASALDFAQDNPDTLILVTADHTHAAQLVPETTHYSAYPVPVYTPGHLARVMTPEGGIMGINYATNTFPYEEHTGASVPLYANAAGRERVPSFLQQQQLFDLMRTYLGLTD
jgi:alkaline phosphatase